MLDVPLLAVGLRLVVAYVGAMGSRHTHDDRIARTAFTTIRDDIRYTW